jgi:hypothetical protein
MTRIKQHDQPARRAAARLTLPRTRNSNGIRSSAAAVSVRGSVVAPAKAGAAGARPASGINPRDPRRLGSA